MAGRRQVGAGIALFLLALALPASGLVLTRSGGGWAAATQVAALAATALLLAISARRPVVVPSLFAVSGPSAGSAGLDAPVLSRLCPAAPGRPEQPRAPASTR
jgi:hypothetical protein